MECPKCKKHDISVAEQVVKVSNMFTGERNQYDNKLLYIVCNNCKFKAFGSIAKDMFNLQPMVLDKFSGWKITDGELISFLSTFENYKKAIDMGWNPDISSMWYIIQQDMNDFCIADLYPGDIKVLDELMEEDEIKIFKYLVENGEMEQEIIDQLVREEEDEEGE
jgi:predicted nucleic-acid-binding Zn-ribbon protein